MLANARDLVDFAGPARSFTNCRIGMARRRRDPGRARQPQGGEEARAGAWVEDRPEESSHASETCALVSSPQTRGVIATRRPRLSLRTATSTLSLVCRGQERRRIWLVGPGSPRGPSQVLHFLDAAVLIPRGLAVMFCNARPARGC
jgi:hypothetical protein